MNNQNITVSVPCAFFHHHAAYHHHLYHHYHHHQSDGHPNRQTEMTILADDIDDECLMYCCHCIPHLKFYIHMVGCECASACVCVIESANGQCQYVCVNQAYRYATKEMWRLYGCCATVIRKKCEAEHSFGRWVAYDHYHRRRSNSSTVHRCVCICLSMFACNWRMSFAVETDEIHTFWHLLLPAPPHTHTHMTFAALHIHVTFTFIGKQEIFSSVSFSAVQSIYLSSFTSIVFCIVRSPKWNSMQISNVSDIILLANGLTWTEIKTRFNVREMNVGYQVYKICVHKFSLICVIPLYTRTTRRIGTKEERNQTYEMWILSPMINDQRRPAPFNGQRTHNSRFIFHLLFLSTHESTCFVYVWIFLGMCRGAIRFNS